VQLALVVFVLGLGAACVLYSGGNWSDVHATGFSLAHNFWCDLVRLRAIDGADNAWSRRCSSLALVALGFASFWFWAPAGSFAPVRARRFVVSLGRFSTLGLYGVALFPSDRQPVLHGGVALAAAALGASAAAISLWARIPGEEKASLRRLTGLGLLLSAFCNAVLYVTGAYAGAPQPLAEPLVQKLATVSLLAWMLSTLHAACSKGSTTGD
jgi:hypothetical protein